MNKLILLMYKHSKPCKPLNISNETKFNNIKVELLSSMLQDKEVVPPFFYLENVEKPKFTRHETVKPFTLECSIVNLQRYKTFNQSYIVKFYKLSKKHL